MKIKFRGSKSEETWPGIILVYLFPHPLNLISLSLSRSHTHFLPLSLAHTLSTSLSLVHTLSPSLSRTHALSFSHCYNLSISLVHTLLPISLFQQMCLHSLTFLPFFHLPIILLLTLSTSIPYCLLHSQYTSLSLFCILTISTSVSLSHSHKYSHKRTPAHALSLSLSQFIPGMDKPQFSWKKFQLSVVAFKANL